jgi:putative transcriptional regulator
MKPENLCTRFFDLRCALGLTQAGFADRFGLPYGVVCDLEQGRSQPVQSLRVLLAAIERDPAAIEQAAKSAWGSTVCP